MSGSVPPGASGESLLLRDFLLSRARGRAKGAASLLHWRAFTMQITVFTLFPHWFEAPFGESVMQRAREAGTLDLRLVNFRDWAEDKHKSVDDTPYGGGGGMVLRAEPLAAAMDATLGPPGSPDRGPVIYLSPRGRTFDQQRAIELSQLPKFSLLCGHYEAVDQRLLDTRVDEELSLGDFVLTGGEIAAMAVVDAVVRLLPGVLGCGTGAETDSFMNGLLEGPHYTRPEVFEGLRIPEVLKSGNHAAVAAWREEQALAVTRERRPELAARLLVYPDQLRRIARRGRPIAIYTMEGGQFVPLFVSRAVLAIDGWLEIVRRTRASTGISPAIRWCEVKEARAGSEEEDRERLRQDALAVLQEFPAGKGRAEQFARNLLAEIHRLGR